MKQRDNTFCRKRSDGRSFRSQRTNGKEIRHKIYRGTNKEKPGGHFDFARDTVGDVADEFEELRVGVLVPEMLGDKFF